MASALRLKSLFLLLLAVWVSGCSVYSAPGQHSVPVETQPQYTEIDESSGQPGREQGALPRISGGASSASHPLLVQSAQARERGDYEQSLALLERAQRIEPRNARVYLELAATHEARGDEQQAQVVAERGLLYCIERSVCEALRSYAR